MITVDLFKALEKRGIIENQETELEVYFEAASPFGDTITTKDIGLLTSYKYQGEKIIFNMTRLFDAKPIQVTNDDVIMFDCMDPVRLASAYDIDENGNPTIFFVEKETDARTEIMGKISVKVDGYQLKNGNRIVLTNDVSRDLKNVVFTVKGCGEKIELSKPRGRPKKVNSLDDLD